MAKPTTTTYLILGMLASRAWSAYEIAEQIGQGLTELWPRAARGLYIAPKRLVEDGFARAKTEATGRRKRTVYSITSNGHRALRQWLATDAKPPALEFEGMIRVLLADEGDLEDLRRNLRLMVEQADEKRHMFAQHAAFMEANAGGTHPERRHLLALANLFMIGHYSHIVDWANWALRQTETWPDTRSPATTHVEQTTATLRSVADRMAAVSQRSGSTPSIGSDHFPPGF